MTINNQSNQTNSAASEIQISRLNNDVNGNPRYVAHFLDFNTNEERASNVLTIGEKYSIAIIRAKTVGGKSFHNKQFGGGISWSNYGCNQEFINYSFEAFAKSKDYYQADTLVALTIINSQDIANQIKSLVEQWCINGRGWNTHPIAIVSQAVQDYAHSKESKAAISTRFKADVYWLAAVILILYYEQNYYEDRDYQASKKKAD